MKKAKAGYYKFKVKDEWSGVHIVFSATIRGEIEIEQDMPMDELLDLIGKEIVSVSFPENIKVRRIKLPVTQLSSTSEGGK